jgi:ribosomal protein S11
VLGHERFAPHIQELAIEDVHVQLTDIGPYSAADAVRALEVALGFDVASPVDAVRLNVTGGADIGVDDAVWILRRALGL